MLRNGLIILSALCAACSASLPESSLEQVSAPAQVSTELAVSPAEQLAADLAVLASDALQGRKVGTAQIDQAAQYIQQRLQQMGLAPYRGAYLDPFTVGETPAFNVVAELPSTAGVTAQSQQVVVIGAHYDHIGLIQSQGEDVIANGANDNASGVAMVLAVASALQQLEVRQKRVVFALFSAEEVGLLGSKHLAKRMFDLGESVTAVLNFEMIGIPMRGRGFTTYATGYDLSNVAQVFNHSLVEHSVAISQQRIEKNSADRTQQPTEQPVGRLDKAIQYQLFKRSDNYPFYQQFNVPAHTFSSFDFSNFIHYHQVGDEFDTLDMAHVERVYHALLPGIIEVVNQQQLTLVD